MARADESAKFSAWSDRALATVVLAVNPSLLYISRPRGHLAEFSWTVSEEDLGALFHDEAE